MRYIKLFESYDFGKEEEVREYFKENIPYLIDKGFSIYSAEYRKFATSGTKKLEITLAKTDGNPFSWEEVKYDFIPLLEVVSKKYKLSEKILFIGYKDIDDKSAYNNFRTYDDIINDNVNDNVSIYRIRIIIEI
jgi:hypothetical protein